jgi:ferric-dicitrate binding protein FerR (iron transport regulator)
MLRPFAEVPGYLLTAIAGIGLLLFGQFMYVLVRDAQYVVIGVGLTLFAGTMLFRRFRQRRSIRSRDSRAFTLVACLGASIAVAIPPMLLIHNYMGDARIQSGTYSTRIGEHRCEDLPDRSRVCLNTNSDVRFAFGRRARNVELISGEASFAVRNDPRPFDVACANLLIHDVGTAFNIYKKDGSAQVTVIEGRIRVFAPFSVEQKTKFDSAEATDAWKNAPEYHRLQQVEYDEAAQTLHDRPALSEQELVHRMAWQEGWIVMDGLSLGEALAEFSRYQPATRFEYADGSLARLRVGGNADAKHLDDFLVWLDKSQHIHHTITTGADGSTVITLSQHR